MAILYIASEADRTHLRQRGGPDYMDELLEALSAELTDVDANHQVLLKEALRQCRFEVDPVRAGEWVVKYETEQRWLMDALAGLGAALEARAWPWQSAPPDPDTWLHLFGRATAVIVDSAVVAIDLSEYADWITGNCKACGAKTTGLFDFDDALTAKDFERYAESAAKGDWWCDECYSNRCDDCGEQLRAPEDDECCAECRTAREAPEPAQ